jgi:hypothetical protein
MPYTYKKLSNFITKEVIENIIRRLPDNADIPFDPANTDYQNFKAQINADEAQLEDADGNVMSAEEAKAYVATLP